MGRDAFEVLRQLLVDSGFALGEVRFDASAFGSWLISIQGSPNVRVVWDGKDGWLIIQRATLRVFAGQAVWEDLWLGQQLDDHRPEVAMAKLKELLR